MDRIVVKSYKLDGKSCTKIELVDGLTESTEELAIDIIDSINEDHYIPDSDPWELVYGDNNSLHIDAPVSTLKCLRFLYDQFKGEYELVRGTNSIKDYVTNCHKVSTNLVDSVINVLITDQVAVVNRWIPSIVSALKMECGTKLRDRPTREYLHSINDKYGVIDMEKLEDRVDGLMAMLPIKDRNIKITYGKCRLAIESLIYNISNSRSYSPSRLQELVQDWYKFINSTLNL